MQSRSNACDSRGICGHAQPLGCEAVRGHGCNPRGVCGHAWAAIGVQGAVTCTVCLQPIHQHCWDKVQDPACSAAQQQLRQLGTAMTARLSLPTSHLMCTCRRLAMQV